MTTHQIIIFSIIFVIDFVLTTVIPVFSAKDYKNANLILLNSMKMAIIWSILIIGTLVHNDLQNKVKNKCPELEQIQEPVYRIK